jgi:vacuolar-type H+-ATPase subunit H
MPGSVSPLQVIKEKELDLRQQVDAARQQAEARIQAARAEAEQSVQRADQAGRAEAAAYYQDGIEQAHREAKAITTAATEEADTLRRKAMPRLGEVARQIAELVYAPFNGESSNHRDEAMPG